jgi:hypothetical protein
MEEKFWTESAGYYRDHLAYAAIMVFPEPAGVLVKVRSRSRSTACSS